MRKLLKRIGSVGPGVSLTVASLKVTAAAPATPLAQRLYTDLIVKGWVTTSGGGAWTIDSDVNVSSITDNGVGDLTINWAASFSNANYAVVGMTRETGVPGGGIVTEDSTNARSSTAVRMRVSDSTATAADPEIGINLIAIGLQL